MRGGNSVWSVRRREKNRFPSGVFGGRQRGGSKTCTLRFNSSLKRVQAGEAVVLCFGRRDAPVLRQAVVSRVEVFDLSKVLYETERMTIQEFAVFFADPDSPPPALREALADSGNNYQRLVYEASEGLTAEVVGLWLEVVR